MSPLLVGVVLGIGALFAYDAATRPTKRARSAKSWSLPSTATIAGTFVGAAGAYLFTTWPIAAVIGGIAGAKLPSSMRRARQERVRIERREALAELSGRLRDAIRSGIGLSDALTQAAASAPESLGPALRRLVGSAQIAGLAPAAIAFGQEVDDSSAELLVAALVFADRLGSRSLAEVLDSLAEATASQASTIREARARQTHARTSARIVAAVPVLLLLGIQKVNPVYLEPYHTPMGQAVLAFAFGLIAMGYQVMRRIARLEDR